jgi:hypothetical protein
LIKIDPDTSKVCDLENQIANTLNIPASRVIILLRHHFDFNNYLRIEYFNMSWAQQKPLKDLRTKLSNGSILFVEENDPVHTKYEQFNWHVTLTSESEVFKLHVNTEAVKGDNEDGSWNSDILELAMRKTKTL